MPKYYVNKQENYPNGHHEVHKEGCFWLKQAKRVIELGELPGYLSAIQAAKKHYGNVEGCTTCCQGAR